MTLINSQLSISRGVLVTKFREPERVQVESPVEMSPQVMVRLLPRGHVILPNPHILISGMAKINKVGRQAHLFIRLSGSILFQLLLGHFDN